MADRRRRDGVIGRLDGIPLALKDNFDVAGWPTRAGLPGRARAGGATRMSCAAACLRRGAGRQDQYG
jgi:Asp-tRNA(Asn)/Glu-tRNA(Gln) amidotransferase A subunit family amidase